MLRGQPVPALPEPRRTAAKPAAVSEPASAWSILGLTPGASASAVRRAFHTKALETHPDQGGDAERFRLVMRAFERLTNKTKRRAKTRQRS